MKLTTQLSEPPMIQELSPVDDKVRIVVVLHPVWDVLPLDGLQLGGRVVEVGPAGVDPGGRVSGTQHLVLQASG